MSDATFNLEVAAVKVHEVTGGQGELKTFFNERAQFGDSLIDRRRLVRVHSDRERQRF